MPSSLALSLRAWRAGPKLHLRKNRTEQGERVFVSCSPARTTSRETGFRYDGSASGATVYAYVKGDPNGLVDPYGLWSSGFSLYAGVGGGVSFGVDPNDGGFFVTFSFGFGVGESITLYNPGGSRPGSKPGDCSHARIGVDVFGNIGGNVGPIGAGINGNLGRTFYPAIEKDSELYGGVAPQAEADWNWGESLGGSVGGEITLGYTK